MGKTAKELSEADTFTLLSPSFFLVLLFFNGILKKLTKLF